MSRGPMMENLAAHQAALEHHFCELVRERAGSRIFALEHGLGAPQRVELERQLRSHCGAQPPSEDHWLVWTVYAAEIGYSYAGREYWQTFEKQTQGWRENGSRHWIRECFQRFASTFGGFIPVGPWAEHFSIICWPIVHAVLPKDLQARIARILYDIRRSFSTATLGDPNTLGTLIATRGWLGSARLEQLADDVEVIGSIALALLFRDREHAGVPLLSTTVNRIAEDLAGHRHAREWLNDARNSAGAVTLKGLRAPNPVAPAAPPRPGDSREARQFLEALGAQPTVRLRPTPDGWLVMLALPNLSPLLTRFPELREYLETTRPTVVGSSGQLLARQQVLQGNEQIPLRVWPSASDVILLFDKAPELLNLVLSAECLLRPGPTWLFRIGSDKIASELRGRAVRTGHEFLILVRDQQPPGQLQLIAADIACDGVFAYRLRVPDRVDDSYVEALRAFNLGVARSVRVRPAGLAAASWDGHGYGEWLAGERPCLAVTADHDVASIVCRLRPWPELVVPGHCLAAEQPVFLEFPELPVGAHIATLELTSADGSVDHREIELLVRERRPWAPGLTHDGALTVIVDPPAPTLEALWSDRATIDVHGPAGHSLDCVVRFWNRPGREERYRHQLPPAKLPIARHRWASLFRTYCRLQEDSQNAYDQADGITVDFVVPGVGRFELSAEREFAPLRWVASYKKQQYSLRLLDDRGTKDTVRVVHYPFESPAASKAIEASDIAGDGTEVDGGLYVALADEWTSAIVVAPRKFHLQQRAQQPHVSPVEPSVDSIVQHLAAIERWSRARQVGSAFSLRFAISSVRALIVALYGALAGQPWAQLEAGKQQTLRRAIGNDALSRELSGDTSEYARITPERRVERFEQTLMRALGPSAFRRSSDDPRERLAEVALRFASDPGGVRVWADTNRYLTGMINRLLHSPESTRAARYLVLATSYHLAEGLPSDQGLRYPGWEW
jgi:hypothetical protein